MRSIAAGPRSASFCDGGSALDAGRFFTTVREATPLRQLRSATAALYIYVDRPRLVSDLQEFLQGRGFIAVSRRGEGLDVSIPSSRDTMQARRVVRVYLTVWQAVHPGVRASIVQSQDHDRVSSAA